MRQLTINIPNYCYKAFIDYFKRIPEASLLNDSAFVVDEKLLQKIDERQKMPDKIYLMREEPNRKIKQKKWDIVYL